MFTANGWLIAMIRACEDAGVPADNLLASEELSLEAVCKPNKRIQFDVMTRLWGMASKLTADPTIGLKTAEFVRPTTFGPLTYAIYSSPTVYDALYILSRYGRIFSDAAVWWLREKEEMTELVMMSRGKVAVEVIDAGCGAILKMLRDITSPDFKASEINLGRPKPMDPTPWSKFFDCPLQFTPGLPAVIRFPRDAIRTQLLGYDPELYQQSIALIKARMAVLNRGELTSLVRAQIMENMVEGTANISEIAKDLNIGIRTLQRHLTEEGYSFTGLMDEIRREFAERYLMHTKLSVSSISSSLGFTSVSSFSRAFHRWYNLSPKRYRNDNSRGIVDPMVMQLPESG